MKKHLELSQQNSCLNKASDQELIFVLLERDPAAPETIRFWAKERIRLGKNQPSDPQIVEALEWADKASPQQLKVFSMNDDEWYVGYDLAACIEDYRAHYSDEPEYSEDARELEEEELENLLFFDCDEDERPTGKRSFKEQLKLEAEKGGEFPRLFALTRM